MNEQIMERAPQKLSFSQYVNGKTGQSLVANAIKDTGKRNAFITAIVSAVSTNPGLQECTAPSIISAALQGVSMGLAPSPQLGQFYMVPFKDRKTGTTVATFVPGYKGYIQLAYRSGQYADLDARPVVEGEYRGRDRYTGRPVFEWIEDDAEREIRPVVGYMAYFELINGARKVLYWSKEKMIQHADRYSPAFSRDATTGGKYPKVSFADYEAGNYPKNDEWKYSSFWYKDFDSMALKTMLRQLISKWGPVSIEMEKAVVSDEQNEIMGVDYGAVETEATAAPASEPAEVFDTEGVYVQEPGRPMSLDDL